MDLNNYTALSSAGYYHLL